LAWFEFLTNRRKAKKAGTNMSVISWGKELVDGAEAELKTTLDELVKVFKDKLENFTITEDKPPAAAQAASGPETTPVDQQATGASPPVAEPVVAEAPSVPVDPTVPAGNVVDVSTGSVTTPSGEDVTPEGASGGETVEPKEGA
jgi:hypothetical protein